MDGQGFMKTNGQMPLNVNYIEMFNAMSANGKSLSLQDMQRTMMAVQMQMNGGMNHKKIEVTWRNLVYQYEAGFVSQMLNKEQDRVRVILKGLTGHFRSGELTAVMGKIKTI